MTEPNSQDQVPPDDEGKSETRAQAPIVVERIPWDQRFGDEDEISLISMFNTFLRERRLIAIFIFLFAFGGLAQSVIGPSTYTASGSFTPQATARNGRARIAGIAAQFGINVPAGETGQSPEFYADLLKSRWLLRSTVVSNYTWKPNDRTEEEHSGDLVEFFDLDSSTSDRKAAVTRATELLRDRISVTTDLETGIVGFSVSMQSAEMADGVGDRLLTALNEFNIDVRQSHAEAERRFIEGRVEQAQEELLNAEEQLERFFERNRRYENSPELVFRRERLQRRVDLRQQVYLSLAKSLEESKIDEVRNTPVITVIDSVAVPVAADSRHVFRNGVLGMFIGLIVGVGAAILRAYMDRARREEPGEYREFARLKSEVADEIRSVPARVRGILKSGGGT